MSQTQSRELQSASRSVPDPLSTDVEPVGTGLLGSPASLIDTIFFFFSYFVEIWIFSDFLILLEISFLWFSNFSPFLSASEAHSASTYLFFQKSFDFK